MTPQIWGFAMQRLCTWYPLRDVLTSLVAATKPRHSHVDERSAQLCAKLQRDGIAELPTFVDASIVQRIRAQLENLPLRERFAARRDGFTLDKVPTNVHVAEYATEDILACPDVLKIANHPTLLDAAALYLGCKPTISSLSVWWSLPADGTAQEAENYHRDVDDWRFVKFFLYLTDVDDDSGPHCFVRGSHRTSNFLRIRRISDQEIRKAFPQQDLLRINGRAGDAFLEDTFGLHKGQPPLRSRRLLLQVQYSICPIAVYTYRPLQLPGITPVLDEYSSRLYVAN